MSRRVVVVSDTSVLIDLERGAGGVDCPVYRHPVHSIMIRGFRHRGLRRLYERGDPSRVGRIASRSPWPTWTMLASPLTSTCRATGFTR